MVTVNKEYRYYGRSDTGNVRLTEGDVARLYERRQRWEIDRDVMLNEAIDSAQIPSHEDFAYLHLVARPVVLDDTLYDRASEGHQPMQFMNKLISAASRTEVFPSSFSPDLHGAYNHERRADGWAVSRGLGDEWEERNDPSRVLDLVVGLDGSGRLLCGRAAERYEGRLLIFDDLVAGLAARFLSVMGSLYAKGGYLGPVDVGLAVTGLRGGISYVLSQRFGVSPTPFDKDRYRRTEQLSASVLSNDPHGAARKLVMLLLRAITRDSHDPLSR